MPIMRIAFFILLWMIAGCATKPKSRTIISIERQSVVTGSSFYSTVEQWGWKQRDSLAVALLQSGIMPDFMKDFSPVKIGMTDSIGQQHTAVIYVSPDYLSIGTNTDWARVPLTPMAAQQVADNFHCFLPTRKIVDDIYKASKVKLAPIPLTEKRDSSATMFLHHQLIEKERNGKRGLIAGIKKDVVISNKISSDNRPNRVAIYGWHKSDGKPIQPLYTGHVNWYVDYSHGIRLVYRKIWVDGKPMDYVDVLKHPVFKYLLCDETYCDFYRY